MPRVLEPGGKGGKEGGDGGGGDDGGSGNGSRCGAYLGGPKTCKK